MSVQDYFQFNTWYSSNNNRYLILTFLFIVILLFIKFNTLYSIFLQFGHLIYICQLLFYMKHIKVLLLRVYNQHIYEQNY